MIIEFFKKHRIGSVITVVASMVPIIYFLTGIPNLPSLFKSKNETTKSVAPYLNLKKESVAKDNNQNSNSIIKSKFDFQTRTLLDFVINKGNLTKIFDYSPRSISFFKSNSIPLKDTITFGMLDSSKIVDFGFLTHYGNRNYYYGIYNFIKLSTNDNTDKVEGVVVFEGFDNEDIIHPIIFKINVFGFNAGGGFGTPDVILTSYGKILFIPVYTGGNGGFNNHQYYLLTQNGINKIESENWKKDFESKLKDGEYIMNGIEVNLKNMIAKTSIWEKDDPHCCPTGGEALINIKVKNNKFCLANFKIIPKDN